MKAKTYTRKELRAAERAALDVARQMNPGEPETREDSSEWMDSARIALTALFGALDDVDQAKKGRTA